MNLLRLRGTKAFTRHMILITDGHTYGDEQACLERGQFMSGACAGLIRSVQELQSFHRELAEGPLVLHQSVVGETGYLSNVGVRRAWRGKGVAQALVADAFAALRERGQMRVLVSVDADAAPAAIRLYEEAGMRVHERHDWFVKSVNDP